MREYPELHGAIAKGEIHLTGVLMIAPHLGGERHAEILRRARFRSKRELLRLIAEIDPKPEVPALIEPLGPAPAGRATHAAFVEALAGPERELPPGRRPEDWMQSEGMPEDEVSEDELSEDGMAQTDAPGVDARRRVEANPNAPDGDEIRRPLHYKIQFTATQEFVDLLEEVRSLLGHERSGTDLPDVQLRALRALVKELHAKKRAATDHPRDQVASRGGSDAPARELQGVINTNDGATRELHAAVTTDAPARERQDVTRNTDAPARSPERATRHIPARIRRAVFERDASRCAYQDGRGERCRETRVLEIHHRHAHALGGPPTLENLELRCRPHNTLAAEQDFGREHMNWYRGVTEGTALERAV